LGQVTAMSISGSFGPEVKKTSELFLKHNLVHVIASDAHDVDRRPLKLSGGVKAAAAVVGKEKAEAMVGEIPQAIVDDEGIPDWGEPENPVKPRKKHTIKVPWGT
jgi:protein-tyrosine phosphatase